MEKVQLYGAALQSHYERVRRETARVQDLKRKRAALAKMKTSHRAMQHLNGYRYNAAIFKCCVSIAYSVLSILIFTIPAVALILALLRFALWLF